MSSTPVRLSYACSLRSLVLVQYIRTNKTMLNTFTTISHLGIINFVTRIFPFPPRQSTNTSSVKHNRVSSRNSRNKKVQNSFLKSLTSKRNSHVVTKSKFVRQYLKRDRFSRRIVGRPIQSRLRVPIHNMLVKTNANFAPQHKGILQE